MLVFGFVGGGDMGWGGDGGGGKWTCLRLRVLRLGRWMLGGGIGYGESSCAGDSGWGRLRVRAGEVRRVNGRSENENSSNLSRYILGARDLGGDEI